MPATHRSRKTLPDRRTRESHVMLAKEMCAPRLNRTVILCVCYVEREWKTKAQHQNRSTGLWEKAGCQVLLELTQCPRKRSQSGIDERAYIEVLRPEAVRADPACCAAAT